jgi:uncharacterized membrane protein
MEGMDLTRAVALVHVGTAFLFVAGYVGANLLTEIARRTDQPIRLESALWFSGRFDRWLLIPFGTVTSLAGLALVALVGYAWTAPWVIASILLYAGIMGLGIFVWGARGRRIEAAHAAGDTAETWRLLREPRYYVLARLENLALVVVVALMVLRPG